VGVAPVADGAGRIPSGAVAEGVGFGRLLWGDVEQLDLANPNASPALILEPETFPHLEVDSL